MCREYSGVYIFLTWYWMLNKWVFDARLMEQEVVRFFILFHQYNFYRQADWPCSFAVRDSLTAPWYAPLTRTFSSSVPLLFVCSSVPLFLCSSALLFVCSSSVHLSLLRLSLLRLSLLRLFICLFCSVRRLLYTRSGVSLQGHRPIVTCRFDSVRSNHPPRQGLSNCPLTWVQLSNHVHLD